METGGILNLEHLRGGSYYFPLKYTNVGLYMYKKHCIIVDTGSFEEEGKAITDYMVSKGLTLDAIMVTHAHADNLAGAYYIKNKTKAPLYSTKEESLIIENPKRSNYSAIISEIREVEVIEDEDNEEEEEIPKPTLPAPSNLQQQLAKATKNLSAQVPQKAQQMKPVTHFIPTKKKVTHHTVLTHKKCLVDNFLIPGKVFVMPSCKHKFEIIPLPGHSLGQVGIITPDKVFFIGDSLYSAEELSENPIPYAADVTKAKKTLEYLLKSKYTLFVPTHGKPLDFSITVDVYNNQRQIKMLEETILMHLSMPKTTDELVALVLASFDIEENVPNFYLISSTISAYLEDLKKANKLKVIHEKGKTRWFAGL